MFTKFFSGKKSKNEEAKGNQFVIDDEDDEEDCSDGFYILIVIY